MSVTFFGSTFETYSANPTLVAKIADTLDTSVNLISLPVPLLKFLGILGDLGAVAFKQSLPVNSNTIDKLTGSLTVDSSKIYTILNWQPIYTLEQGLKKGLL